MHIIRSILLSFLASLLGTYLMRLAVGAGRPDGTGSNGVVVVPFVTGNSDNTLFGSGRRAQGCRRRKRR